MKFKTFLKRTIMKIKFYFNWCSGKLIHVDESHRQIGLTRIVLLHALTKGNIKIYVSNTNLIKPLSEEMRKLDIQYNDYVRPPRFYYKYFITPYDLNSDKYRGQYFKDNRILVDNSCTPVDIEILIESKLFNIVNGFVFIPYVK